MTALARPFLVLLALAFLSQGANAAKAPKKSKKNDTSLRQNKRQKKRLAPQAKKKAKVALTAINGPKVVRVRETTSVKRADLAVIAHLAKPLTLRGPRKQRLNLSDAKKKIEKTWEITDTRIVSNSDPRLHPITGNATLVVDARTPSKNIFRKFRKRQFIVNISTDGKATVVAERSNTRAAKIMRIANEKFAIRQVVKDTLKSAGVKRAAKQVGVLAMAVLLGQTGLVDFGTQLGVLLQTGGTVFGGVALSNARRGVQRRTQGRLKAFGELTQKLDADLRAGKKVTVESAYAQYTQRLKSVKIGKEPTRNIDPPSREIFVKSLAAWEVARNQ